VARKGFSRAIVVGGETIKATARLREQAPKDGAMVTRVSSNNSVRVPDKVHIDPGVTFYEFDVATSIVAAKTSVVISATYNGLVESVLLIVDKQ
jgi:hypothetical protein